MTSVEICEGGGGWQGLFVAQITPLAPITTHEPMNNEDSIWELGLRVREMGEIWEPGFWVGANRGKCWELGFWVGERKRKSIENRADGWGKMVEKVELGSTNPREK